MDPWSTDSVASKQSLTNSVPFFKHVDVTSRFPRVLIWVAAWFDRTISDALEQVPEEDGRPNEATETSSGSNRPIQVPNKVLPALRDAEVGY